MKKYMLLVLCFVLSICLISCKKDEVIKVYTRDTTSGTRDCFFTTIGFEDAVKDPTVLVKGAMEAEKNDDMINYIKNDENSIGYISLATLEGSNVKSLTYEGVEATEENVLNGSYKLKRNFNYITRSEYVNEKEEEIVEAFLAYMTTKEGKATIKSKDGIVTISSSDPSWNDIKDNYPVCKENNSGVTIKFGGSTSVKEIIKALADEFSSKCGEFVVEQNHTGSGDAYKRTQGSEKDGANYLHIGFASREFKSSESAAENTTGQICVDAVVVVVNSSNSSVTNVTASLLKSIYDGTITKWEELK